MGERADERVLEIREVATATQRKRDIEKNDPPKQFAAKLRRLADAIESGGRFRIEVAGERVAIPANAVINIEHERSQDQEEIEFQLVWEREQRGDRLHAVETIPQ